MANVYGALGQVTPSATTLTALYTVPALKFAICNIIAANEGASTTIRISHAVAGAADATKQYLVYDYTLGAGQNVSSVRILLNAGDVIRVYSVSGNVAFNCNGVEETA